MKAFWELWCYTTYPDTLCYGYYSYVYARCSGWKSISEFYDPFSCNVLLISNHSLKSLFIFLPKTAEEYKLSNIRRNLWFDSSEYDKLFLRSKTLPQYCWYFVCPELWTTCMKIKKRAAEKTLVFYRGIQSHSFPISASYAWRGTLLNNSWQ